jgi:hypothetical protein
VLRLVQTCLKKDQRERAVTMKQIAGVMEDALREVSVGRVFVTSAGGGVDEGAPDSGNVPAMVRPLFGREGIVEQVGSLLDQRRMVTLTGGTGSGVTSVANAVALRKAAGFRGGAWWVPLPVLVDPTLPPVLTAIAMRVRGRGSGVMEELVERMGARSVLLVLDGCSHAAGGVAAMTLGLLRACPGLRVLATARSGLGVEGEQVVAVPPLGGGEDGPARLDAARLFMERLAALGGAAATWRERAQETLRVFQLLKGNPQAIELCAGLAPTMTPAQFEAQLRQRGAVMGTPRVESLGGEQVLALMAAWGLDVQQPGNLAVLMRASVFVGAWSVRAVRAVGGARDAMPTPESADPGIGPATPADQRLVDQLTRLAQAGLVRRLDTSEATRASWMLPEAVRREALHRLKMTPGAEAMVLRGYREYGQALAAQAAARLRGPLAEPFAARLETEFAELANIALAEHAGAGEVKGVLDQLLHFRGLA